MSDTLSGMSRTPAPDTLGPVLHPLILPVGVLVVGLLLQRLVPFASMPRGLTLPLGALFAILGAGLMRSAAGLFHRAGTTPNPTKPTTALVTDGIYRHTRNPMYVGVSSLYLGLALLLNSAWAVLLVVVVVGLLDVAVVRREERFLAARFGDAYRDYRGRVRRWL
jgi:protein-S-isoprenylcysteine O-methyltransferase Ste14